MENQFCGDYSGEPVATGIVMNVVLAMTDTVETVLVMVWY